MWIMTHLLIGMSHQVGGHLPPIVAEAHLIICCEVGLEASELRQLAHYEGGVGRLGWCHGETKKGDQKKGGEKHRK